VVADDQLDGAAARLEPVARLDAGPAIGRSVAPRAGLAAHRQVGEADPPRAQPGEPPATQMPGSRARAEEPEWGGAAPSKARVWPWLALGLVSLALVALLVLLPGKPAAVAATPAAEAPLSPRGNALQWYRQNPDLAEREARAILSAYANAATLDEVLPLVRQRARVEPLIRERWEPLGSPLRIQNSDSPAAFAEVQGTAFFLLEVELQDFRKLRAYFVREDGQMKLDWEATAAYSQVPVAKLTTTDLIDVEVRCSIEARSVALGPYPEDQFHGYLLTIPGSDELFWGFAKIGSPVDEQLLEALDRGRFLLELKRFERVTIELRSALPEVPDNYFEISAFKHVEWVRP
jgi:hypothetical protein